MFLLYNKESDWPLYLFLRGRLHPWNFLTVVFVIHEPLRSHLNLCYEMTLDGGQYPERSTMWSEAWCFKTVRVPKRKREGGARESTNHTHVKKAKTKTKTLDNKGQRSFLFDAYTNMLRRWYTLTPWGKTLHLEPAQTSLSVSSFSWSNL